MNHTESRQWSVVPVGWVYSSWTDAASAPHQGVESQAESVIEIREEFSEALEGLELERRLIVLTWFHLADRRIKRVHPRGDSSRPMRGVFATRSPSRPNPIGIHTVALLHIEGLRLRVRGMDAVRGTPVLDIKPYRAELDGPGRTA